MGEIYSKLDQHNRRVIREELESVLGEVSLQEVKQNTIPIPEQTKTTSNIVVQNDSLSQVQILQALCAYKQAEYKSKFTATCAVTGVVTGLMMQSVRAGSISQRIATFPIATLGWHFKASISLCSIRF